MTKYACRYAIVQFMPYPETGEFANVGVVAVVPGQNHFAFQLELTSYARLTQFFKHLDPRVFTHSVKHLHEELLYLEESVSNGQMTAVQAFELIVRPLEAILRFNKERVKMTQKPLAIANELFDRFVLHDFAQKNNYEHELQTSSLSDLSVRSEDCKKLRIKVSVSEENSELFDEETEIFRPIYCNRSRTVLSPTGC
ncbi:DUF3037 domain-containing protein [Endozoicomonas sp. ALC020]|uniref:DUF3037 domain-containing protein n=1 Tax=unclassified Endozoicomonas TaxID=2644528 RepID=UPI003BAFE351